MDSAFWAAAGVIPLGQQLLDGEVGPEAFDMVLQHVAPLSEQFLHLFLIHQAGGLEFSAILMVVMGRQAVSSEEHNHWLVLEARRGPTLV